MPRGIRARTECIQLVNQRMRQKGFVRQIDLAERIDRKQSTAYNFLNGKPVDYLNFLEFCNVLDFEVQEIADFEVLADTYTQKPQKIEKINNSPSFPPSLLSTCELEYPEGEVALDSPFYVERPPIEQHCYEEIRKPGFLIRIKAPQQIGKSSLLARILHQS